jgi:PAS domain S-box-containing protein
MDISRKPISEYETLASFANRRNWCFDFAKAKKFLQDRKNALVVTCEKEKIQWVSKGFTRMTGYEADEVKGKFPKFLQGAETSQETRKIIRNNISIRTEFSGNVVNYRKNGEKYICKVDIFPIFDNDNTLVNFVAFEREVA